MKCNEQIPVLIYSSGILLGKRDFAQCVYSIIVCYHRHYKGAKAALLLFDITNQESFYNLKTWIRGGNGVI